MATTTATFDALTLGNIDLRRASVEDRQLFGCYADAAERVRYFGPLFSADPEVHARAHRSAWDALHAVEAQIEARGWSWVHPARRQPGEAAYIRGIQDAGDPSWINWAGDK